MEKLTKKRKAELLNQLRQYSTALGMSKKDIEDIIIKIQK